MSNKLQLFRQSANTLNILAVLCFILPFFKGCDTVIEQQDGTRIVESDVIWGYEWLSLDFSKPMIYIFACVIAILSLRFFFHKNMKLILTLDTLLLLTQIYIYYIFFVFYDVLYGYYLFVICTLGFNVFDWMFFRKSRKLIIEDKTLEKSNNPIKP